MQREKGFEINGCVSVPEDLSYDDFWDKFIDFIEANNWSFGGGINEISDGLYINEDGRNGDHVLDQDLKELFYQLQLSLLITFGMVIRIKNKAITLRNFFLE